MKHATQMSRWPLQGLTRVLKKAGRHFNGNFYADCRGVKRWLKHSTFRSGKCLFTPAWVLYHWVCGDREFRLLESVGMLDEEYPYKLRRVVRPLQISNGWH